MYQYFLLNSITFWYIIVARGLHYKGMLDCVYAYILYIYLKKIYRNNIKEYYLFCIDKLWNSSNGKVVCASLCECVLGEINYYLCFVLLLLTYLCIHLFIHLFTYLSIY